MATIIEKESTRVEIEPAVKNGTNLPKTMMGLDYGGPGKIELKEIAKPGIEKNRCISESN